MSTFPSDCRGCGACCFSPGEAYVRVTGADWGRLASDADRLAHFLGHRAFMRMQDGHCAALLIGRTDTGVRTFHCSIYDRRPAVCRELGRGSPECAAEIGRKSAGIAGAF